MTVQPPSRRIEQWTVFLFLLFAAATLTHFVHDGHLYEENRATEIFAHPERGIPVEFGSGHPIPPGGFAPNAYRVLLPTVTEAVRHLPLLHRQIIAETVIEFCFTLLALWLAYLLLRANLQSRPWSSAYQAVAVAALLATLQLQLPWVVPYIRMETMPAACFVLGSLLILSRWKASPAQILLLLAIAILQAFNRAEITAVFGAATILFALFVRKSRDLVPTKQLFALGSTVLLIGAAVQLYMKYVWFPNNTYPPGAPAFTLFLNMNGHALGIFVIAIAPLALLAVATYAVCMPLLPVEILVFLYSGLALIPWVTLGQIQEVRIYMPAMLACAVIGARLIAFLLLPSDKTANAVSEHSV